MWSKVWVSISDERRERRKRQVEILLGKIEVQAADARDAPLQPRRDKTHV